MAKLFTSAASLNGRLVRSPLQSPQLKSHKQPRRPIKKPQTNLTSQSPDNIDYNELKSLIRTHTTPPPGSSHSDASLPVVIPGQTDEALSCFEARFARELGAQHARVDLFVRSKADEFRRRLSEFLLFFRWVYLSWIGELGYAERRGR